MPIPTRSRPLRESGVSQAESYGLKVVRIALPRDCAFVLTVGRITLTGRLNSLTREMRLSNHVNTPQRTLMAPLTMPAGLVVSWGRPVNSRERHQYEIHRDKV
jgi:hypothetical protein